MSDFFFKSKVFKMTLSHSFFAIFNFSLIFLSYFFLKPAEFGYLAGLFILEGILIFFDLTIYNYVIDKLAKLNKSYAKQGLVFFFFKKILIFSIVFLLFNLVFIKFFYWDKIVINEIYILNYINLTTFLSFIIALIVIFRIGSPAC